MFKIYVALCSGYLSTTGKMPSSTVQAHYEQLLEFERGHIIRLEEAGWRNRRIAHLIGRNDAATRRCWQESVDYDRFQRHNGSGPRRATTDREDRLIVRSAVTAPYSYYQTCDPHTSAHHDH
ncbi:uncharacterized protein TNCV_551481 [Trichonephila clavipes]|nr:uncharacterized protein TNCV_551481 [Trichonephila clavipes]